MRGLSRLSGHESCTRVVESCRSKISKSLPIRRRRRKNKNIITYHRQVTVGVMTRTVSSLTSVKKRRNGEKFNQKYCIVTVNWLNFQLIIIEIRSINELNSKIVAVIRACQILKKVVAFWVGHLKKLFLLRCSVQA